MDPGENHPRAKRAEGQSGQSLPKLQHPSSSRQAKSRVPKRSPSRSRKSETSQKDSKNPYPPPEAEVHPQAKHEDVCFWVQVGKTNVASSRAAQAVLRPELPGFMLAGAEESAKFHAIAICALWGPCLSSADCETPPCAVLRRATGPEKVVQRCNLPIPCGQGSLSVPCRTP